MSSQSTSLESVGNSNVVFYSPPPYDIVEIDPENVRFTLHRRGFITCVCGEVVREHVCNLKNDKKYENLKIKFNMCSKPETCRFCENIVQYNYERYMVSEDGKTFCRQCSKEIPFDKGICHDCFCFICYDFLKDCVCCKFCPPTAVCICKDFNSSTEETN